MLHSYLPSFCSTGGGAARLPSRRRGMHLLRPSFHLFEMRSLAIIFSVLLFPSFVLGQGGGFDLANYGVQIEPDKRLMVVLATLDAAQTDNAGTPERMLRISLSPAGEAFRTQMESDLAGMPADLRSKISQFVSLYKRRHAKLTDDRLIVPFVSMAYTLSPAPELNDPVITSDLPGELLDVLDFAPLVREFYRRSGIAERIGDYVKTYKKAADTDLRSSTRALVSDALDYLHTRPELIYTEKVKVRTPNGKSRSTVLEKVETREHDRHFVVVPEMLAPVQSVTFLNVRDDYYVIVSPDKDLAGSDANRAFLQFVIDPLILMNGAGLDAVRPGVKELLDEQRKTDPSISPDVYLAVTRSLVAAVEARQREFTGVNIATNDARQKLLTAAGEADKAKIRTDLDQYRREMADETALALSEAYEKGAVLDFYFSDRLKGVEDSGFDIAASVKDMLTAIDASKEKNRLAENAEARKRALAGRTSRKGAPVAIDNPVTESLINIQKSIEAKDYDKAAVDLKALLAANNSDPRIYYNFARVASLQAALTEDPKVRDQKMLDAKVAYSNVIRTRTVTTDPALISLTYVALARIYEFYNETDYALKLYDAAIKIDDVAGGGYQEALAAKQRLQKQAH